MRRSRRLQSKRKPLLEKEGFGEIYKFQIKEKFTFYRVITSPLLSNLNRWLAKNVEVKMYTKSEKSAIVLAEELLNSDEEILELIMMFNFEDDFDAHDDEKQDRLFSEFEGKWKSVTNELESVYGKANIIEDEEDNDYVPLNGVGVSSTWEVNDKLLYVAYAHEDRETPWLLVIGLVNK